MRSKSLRVCVALAGLAVGCGVLAAGATADNGSTNTHFKVAYWGQEGVFWTCNGVHKVPKSGPITENETCTTPMDQGSFGPFVAGTYQPNFLYFPVRFPNGCGAIAPAIPGSPGPRTYYISDDPGFGQCAQFFTATYTPNLGGGWTVTWALTY
jgi:hypothetical protein